MGPCEPCQNLDFSFEQIEEQLAGFEQRSDMI